MRKTDLVWSLLLVFVAGIFACCNTSNGTQTEEPEVQDAEVIVEGESPIVELPENSEVAENSETSEQ